MIQVLLSFIEILMRLGWNPGKNGRTYCRLHGGKNHYSFSYNEEKGVFHCFACGAKGDKIKLVMLALGVDFKEALGWLGLNHDGQESQANVDAENVKRRHLDIALKLWSKSTAKPLRDNFLARERIESRAFQRLRENPEDELGLGLLETAYKGKDQIEFCLDLLEGDQADQLNAFKYLEGGK